MHETQYEYLIQLVQNDAADDCIVWPFPPRPSGHGEVRHPALERSMHASRAAFEIANGFLPPVVRHICDNSPCVNTRHLVEGTYSDNVADRVNRNRSAYGDTNGRSKLSEASVAEIFVSQEKPSELARGHSVDPKVIRDIRNGVTWRNTTQALSEGDSWVITDYFFNSDLQETSIETKTIQL